MIKIQSDLECSIRTLSRLYIHIGGYEPEGSPPIDFFIDKDFLFVIAIPDYSKREYYPWYPVVDFNEMYKPRQYEDREGVFRITTPHDQMRSELAVHAIGCLFKSFPNHKIMYDSFNIGLTTAVRDIYSVAGYEFIVTDKDKYLFKLIQNERRKPRALARG